MKDVRVVKVGGAQLADPEALEALVRLLSGADGAGEPRKTVLVHGGGPEIGALHEALGVPFHKVDGLRATSERGMDIVAMVLCGLVNKRVVARLQAAGHRVVGASGADLGLLRSDWLDRQRLGRVGGPPAVDLDALERLLLGADTVVLAPVCLGPDGGLLNVNADTVAQSVAIAVGAERLDFVTDVPAVRTQAGPVGKLDPDGLAALVQDPAVTGGMIPKLQASLDALRHGVRQVRVGSFDSLAGGTATEVRA